MGAVGAMTRFSVSVEHYIVVVESLPQPAPV
jgi:hypothetical protein